MIELISAERCVACDICVRVCPRDVFDAVEQEIPVIARQEECQTCFLCELYCPVDALFVAPDAEHGVPVVEEELVENRWMGSFVRGMGWRRGRVGGTENDPTLLLRRLGGGGGG